MQLDWDARARENARYYVATGKEDWTDDEFFASGEQAVAEDVLTDMTNICQGRKPQRCAFSRLAAAPAELQERYLKFSARCTLST